MKRRVKPADGGAKMKAAICSCLVLFLAGSALAAPDLFIGTEGVGHVSPAAEKGQRTLFLSQTDGKPNVELGWWWLGDQIGTAFADHPAFGNLPHEGYLSPLFFRIMKHGRKLPFAPVPADKLLDGLLDYGRMGD